MKQTALASVTLVLRRSSLCAALLTQLAGMMLGAVATAGAPARRGSGAGFSFYTVRIQASKERGSPALSRVREGQTFWIVVYLRHSKPTRTKVVFTYWLGNKSGGRLAHDTDTVPNLVAPQGEAWHAFDSLRLGLAPDARERTYSVRASVTMNGVTQTRTTGLTVYR